MADVVEVEPGDGEGEYRNHEDRAEHDPGAGGGEASLPRIGHGEGVYQRLTA